MQLTIEHIEKEMGGDTLVPRLLADYRVFLAALYSLRAAEMQQILSAGVGPGTRIEVSRHFLFRMGVIAWKTSPKTNSAVTSLGPLHLSTSS